MSCSKPFAERFRALTLVEVMVSQTIAIVVISAMMAVVVAMVNKLQAEVAVSDAQVNLRQVSHLLIRDTQGVGSSTGATAGDFITIADGGTGAADTLTIFRRDESICGGSLPVVDNSGNNLNVQKIGPGATCPFDNVNVSFCDDDDLIGRTLMVLGIDGKVAMMTGHNASAQGNGCKIVYPTGQQAGDVVAAYNSIYDPDVSNINQMFGPVPNGLGPIQILSGTGFTYRLDAARNVLQRSTNLGANFVDILEGVYDFQVQRVYQDGDTTHFLNEGAPLPAGVVKEEFVGLRLGLITFGRSVDGLDIPPPASLANRTHTAAPKNRRYRASFVVTAARNRNGA